MPSRKPLRTLSENVSSATQSPPAKTTRVVRRKVTSSPQKRVKRRQKDIECDTSLVENTPSSNLLGSETLKPEIAEFFIPLKHAFSPHAAESCFFQPNVTPFEVFKHFWDYQVFELLVKNTNEYAAKMRGPELPKGIFQVRNWKPVTLSEMKRFVAQLIFMGVHGCKSLVEFWRKECWGRGGGKKAKEKLSLRRFQQIKRYLHIEPVQIEGRTEAEWWKKVEPLHSLLQQRFQSALKPGPDVSVDEMMVRFGGRSKHTYRMPNKPISEGYRILALCWEGYTWNWLYTSRVSGIAVQKVYDGLVHLTPTSAAICEMIKTLPHTSNQFNVYMDNYFTNVPLFQVLRSEDIGACGTA